MAGGIQENRGGVGRFCDGMSHGNGLGGGGGLV